MAKSKKPARTSKGSTRTAHTIRHLRQQIKQLRSERDGYLTALCKVLPRRKSPWTRKDLREMEAFRPTFAEFVRQLRAETKPSP